jgi:hypothetical protein
MGGEAFARELTTNMPARIIGLKHAATV